MRITFSGRKSIACILFITVAVISGSCAQAAHRSKRHVKSASQVNVNTATPIRILKAPNLKLPASAIVTSEVNMNDKTCLDMIKRCIPALGNAKINININQTNFNLNATQFKLGLLYDSIKGLKAVRITQFQMRQNTPSQFMDITKVVPFFAGQIHESEGWERIFYNYSEYDGNVIAVYARGNDLLGFAYSEQGDQNITFGTIGFVDIPKLIRWTEKAIPAASNLHKCIKPLNSGN